MVQFTRLLKEICQIGHQPPNPIPTGVSHHPHHHDVDVDDDDDAYTKEYKDSLPFTPSIMMYLKSRRNEISTQPQATITRCPTIASISSSSAPTPVSTDVSSMTYEQWQQRRHKPGGGVAMIKSTTWDPDEGRSWWKNVPHANFGRDLSITRAINEIVAYLEVIDLQQFFTPPSSPSPSIPTVPASPSIGWSSHHMSTVLNVLMNSPSPLVSQSGSLDKLLEQRLQQLILPHSSRSL
jgi:hypothetical protein